jgi:hypothetical protein
MSGFPNNDSYPMECTSCGTTIETIHDSHNGFPLVDGRVCGTCNAERVIPARLSQMGLARPTNDNLPS